METRAARARRVCRRAGRSAACDMEGMDIRDLFVAGFVLAALGWVAVAAIRSNRQARREEES